MENFEAIGVKNATEWKSRGKKGDPVLTPAEEAAKLGCATNVKAFRVAIEKKKQGLVELRAKLAKDT